MKLKINHATTIWQFIERDVHDIFSDDESKTNLIACLEGGITLQRLQQMQQIVDPNQYIFDPLRLLTNFFQGHQDVPQSADSNETLQERTLFQRTALLIANISLLGNIWQEMHEDSTGKEKPGYAQREAMLLNIMVDQLTNPSAIETLKHSLIEIQVFLLRKINDLIDVMECHARVKTPLVPLVLELSKNLEINKINNQITLATELKNILRVFLQFTDQQYHIAIQKNLISAGKSFFTQQKSQKKECFYAIQQQWSCMQDILSLDDLQWLEQQISVVNSELKQQLREQLREVKLIELVIHIALVGTFFGSVFDRSQSKGGLTEVMGNMFTDLTWGDIIVLTSPLMASVFLDVLIWRIRNKSPPQKVIELGLSEWAKDLKEKLEQEQQQNVSETLSSFSSTSSANTRNNTLSQLQPQ